MSGLARQPPDPLAVGLAVLDRFTQHNETLKAQGKKLRQAIEAILQRDSGTIPIRAETVRNMLDLAALGRSERPSLRTVRWHLQQIRGKASVLP